MRFGIIINCNMLIMNLRQAGNSSVFQYAIMAAGVSTGSDIMDFIRPVGDMSAQTLDSLAGFAETISDISNDMNLNIDLFASVLGSCDEKNLQDFMDLASKGSNTDKANLLTATANLSNSDLGRFIHQANRYARGLNLQITWRWPRMQKHGLIALWISLRALIFLK